MAARAPRVAHVRAPEAEPDDLADERRVRLVEREQVIAKRAVAREHVHAAGRNVRLHEAAVGAPEQARGDAGCRADRCGRCARRARHRSRRVRASRKKSVISDSGSCRSAAMIAKCSPRAAARPARIAANEPKLRESSNSCDANRLRGSSVAQQLVRTIGAAVHDEHRFERVAQSRRRAARRRRRGPGSIPRSRRPGR